MVAADMDLHSEIGDEDVIDIKAEKPREPRTPEEDWRIATYLAQTRGLPPLLKYEQVRPFVEPYGYAVTNESNWAKVPAEQPRLQIRLAGHSEFGAHTQYEIQCELHDTTGGVLLWATIRRLVHLREGVHDPVKKELQSRYDNFFGKTPFAHHTGPSGTTERLGSWLDSLSKCINGGVLSPYLVVAVFRALDGPGTPVHPEIETIPLTRSIFGGGGLLHNPLVKPFLYGIECSIPISALSTCASSPTAGPGPMAPVDAFEAPPAPTESPSSRTAGAPAAAWS